jgi:hypothetical protein
MINHAAILDHLDANPTPCTPTKRRRSPPNPCLPASLPSTGTIISYYPPIVYSHQFLAVIQREADLTAPKSFLTQLVRDASHSTDALREAMATTITNSPPSSPQAPFSGASPPSSPLQRFFSMAKSIKADKPWRDPEVSNRVCQLSRV